MRFIRRRRKPDYQHIAQLERELQIDGSFGLESLDAELDEVRTRRAAKRDEKRYGPVLLDASTSPLNALTARGLLNSGVREMMFAPGAVWAVDEPPRTLVTVAASATAGYTQIVRDSFRSRVVLPPGVAR